ncbi:MAG: serine/threonine-protein kinase, partial [Verrucomicrobiota bacterium]
KVAEHHGIVTLHEFDLLNEPPYYSMGLHADVDEDGQWQTRTLDRLCGDVDWRESWRLIREVADALSYLHRHQIIHCDIKPSNILLTDEVPHHTKICDFGQSRGSVSDEFEPVGTPLYASPEQLRSPSDSSDGKGFRWDVYSFGVVAYQVMTGRLPRLEELRVAERNADFDPDATLQEASIEATIAETGNTLHGEKLATMVEAVEDIEWPSDNYIPTARRELIERCLSLDPAKRPSDMREVWVNIQEMDQLRAVRRARQLNGIFAVLLVIALWASGFAFFQTRQARKAKEAAETSSAQAQELALIVVNELNRGNLAGTGVNQMYSLIADNYDAFLDNLPKNHSQSENVLRFSAQASSLRGRESIQRGDYDDALEKFQNAYEIRAQLAEDTEKPELAILASRDLMELGQLYEAKGDVENAKLSYSSALDWRLQHPELSTGSGGASLRVLRPLGQSYMAKARCERADSEIDESLVTLQEIYNIYETALNEVDETTLASYQSEMMPILEEIGDTHFLSPNLVEANQAYSKLLELSEALKNSPSYRDSARESQMTALHQLAKISNQEAQHAQALDLLHQEIRMRKQAVNYRPYDPNLKINLADAYSLAAECLTKSDSGTESLAIFYLDQAIQIMNRLPKNMVNQAENEAKITAMRERRDLVLEAEE